MVGVIAIHNRHSFSKATAADYGALLSVSTRAESRSVPVSLRSTRHRWVRQHPTRTRSYLQFVRHEHDVGDDALDRPPSHSSAATRWRSTP